MAEPSQKVFPIVFSFDTLNNLPVLGSLGLGLGDLDLALLLDPADSDDLDLELCAVSFFSLLAASDLEGAGLDDLVRPWPLSRPDFNCAAGSGLSK